MHFLPPVSPHILSQNSGAKHIPVDKHTVKILMDNFHYGIIFISREEATSIDTGEY